MCIDFYGHHSGGSSFVYVNDFCYYRNCLYTIGTVTPPIPVRPDWRIRTGFGVRNHILGLFIYLFIYLFSYFFFQSLTYTCGYTNNFCNNQKSFTYTKELPLEWYPLKSLHIC